MAEVYPIQTKDNTGLYTTVGTLAGAAAGGITGYTRSPYLKANELTDEFVSKAEANLSDMAKAHINSGIENKKNELKGMFEELRKSSDMSDKGVTEALKNDLRNEISAHEEAINYARELQNARTTEDVQKIITKYSGAHVDTREDLGLLKQSVQKSLDEHLVPNLEQDKTILSKTKEPSVTVSTIEAELKSKGRNDLIKRHLLHIPEAERQKEFIKIISNEYKELASQLSTAQTVPEAIDIIENSVPQGFKKGYYSYLLENKENLQGIDKEVQTGLEKTIKQMKTRTALIYGAIGAAALGIITYLAMGSKKAPAEAQAKVDTKA